MIVLPSASPLRAKATNDQAKSVSWQHLNEADRRERELKPSVGMAHWLPRDLSPVWLWLYMYMWLFLEKRFAVSPRSAQHQHERQHLPPSDPSLIPAIRSELYVECYRPFLLCGHPSTASSPWW